MGYPARPVQTIRNDYTSTNVTTSAYVELDSSLNGSVRALDVFDSSGRVLLLAIGAAGSEIDQLMIPPGGLSGLVHFYAEKGNRLSIKAVDASATSGQLVINLYA
jgi:hypothetical protein